MAFERSNLDSTGLALGGSIATIREEGTGAHVFWVANDGTLRHRVGGGGSIVGFQRGKWEDEETIYKPGSTITGGIAAISRYKGHCEVFWVAGSAIMAAFRSGDRQWTTWTLPVGNYTCHPKSSMAAVTKGDSNMDAYWINTQGTVCTASYSPGTGSWSNIFSISSPGAATPEGSIVAISRQGFSHREVFWTTPQQGINAAFSYDKGPGGYSIYEAAPASSVALHRGSIYALSSHQSRMALWWITPDGAVMSKHWADPGPKWESIQTVAGKQEGASGSITAVDRRPSTDDLCYEVAWTRKDGTIGSAKMVASSNNTPTTWNTQTLVSDAPLQEAALGCVLENINFVTLVYPSVDGQSKLLFGNWLEAKTAPAVARSNLIQHGPALKSHLDVTLQGYHQVVAVSQANINATLKYHFENDKRLLQFKYQDNPSEDDWGTRIVGVLSAPTVRLLDRPDGLDEAVFFVNFKSGKFAKFVRSLKEYDMAGWAIAFTVSFSKRDLSHVPDDIKEQVENPGSYSATQLLIDFGTAHLSTFSWNYSSMPSLKTEGAARNWEISGIEEAMKTYIKDQLRSGGPHNVLGYALKVKEGIAPPATFTPKLVRPQIIHSREVHGVVLSEQALENRNAFCFTEMTGRKDEVVEFPRADLQWSGNWFYGSVHGTFALTRSLFLEKFFIPKLAIYNERIMDLANETWHRATNPECTNFPWALSEGGKPGSERFKWNVVSRDDKGHSSLGACMTSYGLPNIFDRPTGRMAAQFLWNDRWDRNKGFKIDYKWAQSQVYNVLSWNPGCGWLTIETSMTLIDSREEVDILFSLLNKRASVDKSSSIVEVVLTTNIILSNIENGELKVVVETAPPIVKANVSSRTDDMLKRFFNGDPAKRNSDLARRVREKVGTVFQGATIRDALQDELNTTEKFVIPGGGTFKMKDAIFNNAGDLAVALTYILKNGTIAVVEGES